MGDLEKLLDDILEIIERKYIIPEIEDYYNDLKEIKQRIENYYETVSE
jgi:hypothetical protein